METPKDHNYVVRHEINSKRDNRKILKYCYPRIIGDGCTQEMGKTLELKCEELNMLIEDVEHWMIESGSKTYEPPLMKKDNRYFGFTHENLIIFAFVHMENLGSIKKIVKIGSDKYRLEEFPKEIHEAVLDSFFTEGPTDILNPKIYIEDQNSKIPKFKYEAMWVPPGSYLKTLKEKRNFIVNEELGRIEPLIAQVYQIHGAKVPNYIDCRPTINVSEQVK